MFDQVRSWDAKMNAFSDKFLKRFLFKITFETALAEAGFWPDKRAGKKGVEPESVTVGTFEGTRYIFVGAERADAVGVYDATDLSNPILKQILPSGIAPEGLKAIPSRNLFVTSNEKDKKVRGNLTIFQF